MAKRFPKNSSKGRTLQATSEVSDNQLNSFSELSQIQICVFCNDGTGSVYKYELCLYCFCSGLEGIQSLQHSTPQINKNSITLRNIQRKQTLTKALEKQYENYMLCPTIIK